MINFLSFQVQICFSQSLVKDHFTGTFKTKLCIKGTLHPCRKMASCNILAVIYCV